MYIVASLITLISEQEFWSILFALVNPAALSLELTRNIYDGNESPAL